MYERCVPWGDSWADHGRPSNNFYWQKYSAQYGWCTQDIFSKEGFLEWESAFEFKYDFKLRSSVDHRLISHPRLLAERARERRRSAKAECLHIENQWG